MRRSLLSSCIKVAENATSTRMKRGNSLKQFSGQTLGIPTAAGIVPLVYKIQLRPVYDCFTKFHCKKPEKTCGPVGVTAIVQYGNTYDCRTYKEYRHDVDCNVNAVYRYDDLETIRDEEKGETSFYRHCGRQVVQLPYHRTFFNGGIIYKADKIAQSCSMDDCCNSYNCEERVPQFGTKKENSRKSTNKHNGTRPRHHKKSKGCGCRRNK